MKIIVEKLQPQTTVGAIPSGTIYIDRSGDVCLRTNHHVIVIGRVDSTERRWDEYRLDSFTDSPVEEVVGRFTVKP